LVSNSRYTLCKNVFRIWLQNTSKQSSKRSTPGVTGSQKNVEYKVEQATLRHELKKYKRSLLEAERNVAKMAEEIKATKNTTDPSFVCQLDHGMSEEEAAQLRSAQEEAEEYKNEAMFAKQEIEELKRELWEVKREKQELESSSPDDVIHLENQVEQLKGQNEDLDLENKTLKQEIEQREDEIVCPSHIVLMSGSSAGSVSPGEKENRGY
jgi:DNA repair exonuclease SbcCD ATPase subunit